MSDDYNTDMFFEDAEFITPPNVLKEKAGDGGIPLRLIENAQAFIKNNDIDYSPYASDLIDEIQKLLKELKETDNRRTQKHILQFIIENIMHIKAHGGMFGYNIMTTIAGKTLTFLDDDKKINEDLFNIIEAHNISIKLIISHKNKGDGGAEGKALVTELDQAINRYLKKYND